MEESLESGKEKILDGLQRIRKEDVDWLFSPRPGILERYKGGALKLHLHLLCRGREMGELCAVLYHASRNTVSEEFKIAGSQRGSEVQACRGDPPHARLRDGRSGYLQRPMLISVRELIEKPQLMPGKVLPSVVRLHTLDDRYRLFGHPVNVWAVRFSIERGILKDWEGGFGRGRSSIDEHQLPGKVVQTGPQIVQAIADKYGQPSGGLVFDSQEEGSAITAMIGDHLTEVTVEILPDFIIQ